jgi:hypothetical protein
MPNGRPHDHPLTDITVHKIRTYSPRVDSLVRKIHKVVSPILWDFLYLLEREGDMIRVGGSKKQIPIQEFEDMLAELLESAEILAEKFKAAKKEIKKK